MKQNKWLELYQNKLVDVLVIPLLAVFFAMAIGALIIVIGGKNPVTAYGAMLTGAFGSAYFFAETLVSALPLIFTGLSVAFAFRCGLFNIGAEGQFIMGQMAAAAAGAYIIGLPPVLHVIVVMLAAMIAGGIWGGIPGILKAKLGVHEVINTIMLNWIALYLNNFLISGPLKDPKGTLPATPVIQKTAWLTQFQGLGRLNTGIFIALLALVAVWYLLWKTTIGYEVRAVGFNQHAAEQGGISVAKNIFLAMLISGALAGLAGAVQVAGVNHKAYQLFAHTGYGFDGIAVALLGKNHPAGIFFSAVLFGALGRGGMTMQAVVSKHLIRVVQAIIIFLVAADGIIRWMIARRKKEGGVSREA